MRIALFARYSSKLQDEMSLEAQLHEMEAHVARQQDWRIVRRFLLPETRSADLERSDEFQQMIAAARRKEFDILLVHKLDRFGRDRETSVVHKAMLRRLGIQVTSVAENLGESIMDRAMEGMMEVMAEWYSGNLGQETRKGQRALTRRGLWRGGKVPFGLLTVDVLDGTTTRKKVGADPKTGPVMVKVYEMVAQGRATGEVIDYIKAATGEEWSKPTFYLRLANPIYKGLVQYGKTELQQGRRRKKGAELTEYSWEGLVSADLWERANGAIRARGQSRGAAKSTAKVPYLLSGLARCQRCGASITGSREAGQPRYSCSNRRQGTCTSSGISAKKLDAMILGKVVEFIRGADLDQVEQEYEASLAVERDAAQRREVVLRKALAEVRKKVKNILTCIENGLSFEDMHERIRELKAEESQLADEIGRLHAETGAALRLNRAVVREWLGQLQQRIEQADPAEVATLLRHFVHLELDLVEKTGTLRIALTPETKKPEQLSLTRASSGPRPDVSRSARTRPWTCVLVNWAHRQQSLSHNSLAVISLLRSGLLQWEVAERMGLSKQRVSQIASRLGKVPETVSAPA